MYLLSKWVSEKISKIKLDQFKTASIIINIMLLSTCYYLYTAVTETHKMTVQKTDELYELIDYYQCQVDSLATLSVQKHVDVNIPTKQFEKKIVKNELKPDIHFGGFLIAKDVDRYLQNTMCEALTNYTGPGRVLITSMRRKWCKHSQHSTGRAIDINMDRNGRAMLNWMMTHEGIIWLHDHSLDFYVEDKPKSHRLDEFRVDYADNIFENPHATGLHIHLYKR